MSLQVISYQGTRKFEADYKPTHITETNIGYIVCGAALFIVILFQNLARLVL